MKNSLIFIICLMLSVAVIGQTKTKSPAQEGQATSPIFTGTAPAVANLNTDNSQYLNNYIFENLICPKRAEECCIEGTEIVQFTVTPEGKVNNFNIVNSICPEIDKEVIRVLKTTNGKWLPAQEDGEYIAMKKEVTVLFGNCTASNFEKHFVQNATNYFEKGSKNLLVKNNPEKALKSFNEAIKYLPNDNCLLLLRGLCFYELGDKESARKDFNRIKDLGGIAPDELTSNLTGLKGYTEMIHFFADSQD